MQYQGADVFMICVSSTEKTNLDSITKWKAEVQDVESSKPILLIMTKSDLAELSEEPITVPALKQKSIENGFQGYSKTSSKEWEDHNVHKAFTKALATALQAKYESDDDDSDD